MERHALRPQRGFTLLESMVAVAVTAILSTVALPSIEGQLQRVRRADALVAVLAVQLAQERWRSSAPAYGTLAQIGSATQSPQGHYALQASATGADGYTLTATALGAQQRDTRCRVLQVTVSGGQAQYASGPDAALGNDAATNRRCWNR